MFKKSIALLCCLLCALSLAACDTGFGSLPYEDAQDSEMPSELRIAENETYTLDLDDRNFGLTLTEKSTGLRFSTTPEDPAGPQLDEFGMPIKKHPRVESLLSVECKNFVDDESNTYYSYTDAVQDGQVTCQTIQNGVRLQFYFAEARVMIPLNCTLTPYGVRLEVDSAQIREDDNKVVGLSLAPFFCGVKNDAPDSYLFVPSGSGALVGTESVSGQGNAFSAQVYGYDPAIDEVAQTANNEPVRLGVFGAKSGAQAMLGIIEAGAGSASVNVTAGATSLGYSACYASFTMRGYTNHVAQLFSYEKVENVVYSKKHVDTPVAVLFCPLFGEQADYSGMAALYRDYLTRECGLQTSGEEVPFHLRLIGGTTMTKSFLGIPYETVYPTTTLSQAQAILEELKNETGARFSAQLKGFGESGADVGKIAGNYTVNKRLGSRKELQNLFAFAQDSGVDLCFDFDLERFNKKSADVSKFYDAVTNAGEQKALQYDYDVAVKDKKQETAYSLLSPAKFLKIADKIAARLQKYKISAVSLDTLASVAYSDYKDKANATYYAKNGFAQAATDAISRLKDEGVKFTASGANLYAAVLADRIAESPVNSQEDKIFRCDVPFYQMVFKGSVPLTVRSVNLAADMRLAVLRAIESGSGLGYTVISDWDPAVLNADTPEFYGSCYDDLKETIVQNYKELSGYYEKIAGQHIVSHTVHDTGLRETVFENGVRVYVNETDRPLATPTGELAAYDYRITEK